VDTLLEVARALRCQVMAPLVLGGPIVALRPVGAAAAAAVAAAAAALVRDEQATLIDVGRSRQARKLAPIDAVDAPGLAQWLMIVALQDLVQATHPKFAGAWRAGRAQKLLRGASAILDQVPAPSSAREALARHATFARLLELHRLDTHVSWWCGAADYLGRCPPPRLLWLRGLRRVSVQQSPTDLSHMAHGSGLQTDAYLAGVAQLLALSPLTDLATVTRSQPSFVWTRAIAQLLATPAGIALALRALRLNDLAQTVQLLERAGMDSTVCADGALVLQIGIVLKELAAYRDSQRACSQGQPPGSGCGVSD
jgi:hypothetical protein